MAMIEKTKSLHLHGFSSNIKNIEFEDFVYVLKREKFSIVRAFFLIALASTFVVARYFS